MRFGTPDTPINVGCTYLAKEYNRESVLSLFGALTAIAVNVPVRVDAPLPADVLQIALEEAESIFRPGGVIWE
ncbi:MAG TPA: hypothetical protein VEK15_06025, partial [Vicinamibacteria bacterium]|nr:hypothetical protein [Vicinamibacteria bacterium]